MREGATFSQRFVARLRALLEEDWRGRAGAFFRRGVSSISDVNDRYLQLEDKAAQAPDLAWRAVQGLAGEKHAKAISDYARAENDSIDLALKQRVLDDKVRQEKATADKLEAEAALAKINELKARAELVKTLQDLNLAMTVDRDGVIRIARCEQLPADLLQQVFTLPEKRLLGTVVDITIQDSKGIAQKSLGQVTLVRWICRIGDRVERDQPIFEISSDALDAEIPSPAEGILSEILVEENSIIQPDTIVGRINKD